MNSKKKKINETRYLKEKWLALHKILNFHQISWRGNFVESFRKISGESHKFWHTNSKASIEIFYLTLSWRRSLSYRSQPNDLLYKPVDWFLYDRDLRHQRITGKMALRTSFPRNALIWYLWLITYSDISINFSFI